MANKKSKNENSTSRKYLKWLGWIEIALGVIAFAAGIFFLVANINFAEIQFDYSTYTWVTVDNIKYVFGSTLIFAGFFAFLEAWLLLRAAKYPEKSTLILVLTVLSAVSSFASLITSITSSMHTGLISNTVVLAINVLTVMAILDVRKSIE